jgi:putative spermidine/putrescine transport system ATP-binding protein
MVLTHCSAVPPSLSEVKSSSELGDLMRTGYDLELVHLTKCYGGTVAVLDLNHVFAKGSYVCLLGPSGCGKSSTLRMIAGHEDVSDGQIVLDGQDVSDLPPARRGTAMMFQNYALFPHLSVRDNVAFSLRMKGVEKETLAPMNCLNWWT